MIRRFLSIVRKYTLCVAASILLSTTCVAQSEAEEDSPKVIDEIVVYGERSLYQLRREIYRAEVNPFEVFNELNSDDEFDVECEYDTRVGMRRRFHHCWPRFAREASQRATYEMMTAMSVGSSFNSYFRKQEIMKQDERLWQEMAALVRSDPGMRKRWSASSMQKGSTSPSAKGAVTGRASSATRVVARPLPSGHQAH